MRTLKFFKAQAINDTEETETTTLVFDEPFPVINDRAQHTKALQLQGKLLAVGLISTLPQGVIDELLIQLLDHTRSLLVVVHPKTKVD